MAHTARSISRRLLGVATALLVSLPVVGTVGPAHAAQPTATAQPAAAARTVLTSYTTQTRQTSAASAARVTKTTSAAAKASAQAEARPAATPTTPTTPTLPLGATVGPLFQPRSTTHACTASVISSASGDLVLTAAHCVTGTGAGMTFAPGYEHGTAPYGTWTVVAAYAAPGWTTDQNPLDDVAVLRVAPRTIDGVSRSLQSVVGAERVGATVTAGSTVTGLGYVAGVGGSSTSCTTRTTTTASSLGATPTLGCAGFADGTSGGPWLARTTSGTTLVGIVGGLHQGGCSDDVSYTPPIGTTVTSLIRTADAAGRSSVLPQPGPDGC